MSTDLPPYLTHIPGRKIPWTQHNTFPRNVVKTKARDQHYWHGDLRIFKRYGLPSTGIGYHQMSEAEIRSYMENSTRV